MNVNYNNRKGKNLKNNNPLQQMIVPVYPQPPMIYQNQIIPHPQPIYQMIPQQYGMIQPIPVAPQPMVAVPAGTPVMMAKPISPPVMVVQPVATPQAYAAPIQKPQQKKIQKIIVKKQHKPQQDECCNIY